MFLAFSCGPSVDGESKNWTNNLSSLKQLKTTYPAFATVIDEKILEATKIYEAASGISDEEKKADAMRNANNNLTTGCVGNLMNVETKFSELKKKQQELKALIPELTQSDIAYVEMVLEDLDRSIKKTKKVLKDKKKSSSICADFEEKYSDMISYEEDIDRAIKNMNTKINDKKDTTKVNSNNKTNVDNTNNTPKDIKCEYCGSYNKAANTKCSSCGANLNKE